MPVVRCSPEACGSGDRGVQSGKGAPEAKTDSPGPTKPHLSGFLVAKSWFIVACCSVSGGKGLGKVLW